MSRGNFRKTEVYLDSGFMYEIFEKLLKEKGISAYQVAKDLGIGTATISDWKHGRSTPKQDKLKKIAKYFNVSVEYLITGNDYQNQGAFDFALLEKFHSLTNANQNILLAMIDSMLENQ